MKSLWKQDVVLKVNNELCHDTSVNTVVVGAGMTGILTAYLLQKRGIDTIVLEAARIGSGQTGNTTAKITSQHGLFYSKMKYKVSRKRLKGYAIANEEAIDRFGQIVKKENIDCDFEHLPAVLYTTDFSNVRKLRKEAKSAKKLGINVYYKENMTDASLIPVNAKSGVIFENQAQFHPLKFIKALSQKLTVYENTPVMSVKGHTVYTNRGKIEADHIVFATHYPFINMPGFYFMREHRERSYILALKGVRKQKWENKEEKHRTALSAMYYSIDKNGLSFRCQGDLLLLGGGNHRTGKKTSCKSEDIGYTFLRKIKEKYYSDAEIVAAWSAQDCMPHDDIPFIGKYSVFRPYWYVATGFKKWGMTTSMIAAEIISDAIRISTDCGVKSKDSGKGIERFAGVFAPQRILFRASICNFVVDMWESAVGLIRGIFSPVDRKCPHMGCRLEWNDEEKSWDCPCHGSRFTNEGELIDNPAQIYLQK